MKKITVLIIFYILVTACFGGETNETVRGIVVREHQNQHNGIKIMLKDKENRLIAEEETIFTGDFSFENIKQGEYKLEIIDANRLEKKIDFIKESGKKKLDIIKISSRNFYGIYLFSNIILLLTIIINFIIIYFMKKRKEIIGRKYLIYSVIGFNIWFIIEFLRFITGISAEYISAKLWALPNVGPVYSGVFMLMFLLKFPIKRDKKQYNLILWGSAVVITIALIMFFSWIFNDFYNESEELIKLKFNLFTITFEAVNFIFMSLSMIVLFKNWRENKGKYSGDISIIMCQRMGAAVLMLVFIFLLAVHYSIKEIFDGYYKTIFSLMDITIYWGILKYGLGFRYVRKYKYISEIFIEIFKYLVMIIIVFTYINILGISGMENIPMSFMVFIIIKVVFDSYFKIKSQKEYIDDQSVLAKLSVANTRVEAEYLINNDFKTRFGIKKSVILYRDEFYKIEDGVIDIEGESALIERFDNSVFDEYEYGIKIRFNNEIIALLLVSKKEGKSFYKREEIEFLIDFAQNGGHIINSIIINELKTKLTERGNEKKRNKIGEKLPYIERYLDIIEKKSSDKEVIGYCVAIREKLTSEVDADEK